MLRSVSGGKVVVVSDDQVNKTSPRSQMMAFGGDCGGISSMLRRSHTSEDFC